MTTTHHPYLHSLKITKEADSLGYPFDLPVVKYTDEIEFHPKVTYIVGENGSGKSTLLEAMAVGLGFNPEGGTKNFNFATKNSHSSLHEHIKIHKHYINPKNHFFLRAESFYNVATEIEVLDKIWPLLHCYGGKSLHNQSHGESFFSLFMHRFGADGLYILDEPEAALSPDRQLAFLVRMHELIGQNCQFVISTHSPIILSYPDALIYEIGDDGLRACEYEDTQTYRTSKYFINNYHKMHEGLGLV